MTALTIGRTILHMVEIDGRQFAVPPTVAREIRRLRKERAADVAPAPAVRLEPPWAPRPDNSALIEGWRAYHAGKGRDTCPFPGARHDLRRDYQIGWDRAWRDSDGGPTRDPA